MTATRTLLLALIAATAVALALPGLASAARNAEVSLMDDPLLLGRSQGYIDKQMRIIRKLGVDRVRVSAFWIGNAPDTKKKPAGFNPFNPNDPQYRWAALDRVVESANAHGLRVMLSITTPAPHWALTGKKRNSVWSPSAVEFAAYAYAVASRYANLVDHYGVANEPNQGGWLQPQSDRHGLISPHRYRAMLEAAYPAIKRADPTSTVLIGNLAPSGTSKKGRRAPIRPIAFLRSMACVSKRYRPVTTGKCKGFRPIPADAVGHHPYQFFRRPSRRSPARDDVGIGDGRRLLRVLDRLTRLGRIVPSSGSKLNVFYTEFGYQTFPPDPFAGIPPRRQSRWLQEAAYLVWKTPRIRGLNQFRLTDGAISGKGLSAFKEFQTGLLFSNRRKKPSYRSFPNPFVIAGRRFWGQVRPRGAHTVQLQRRAPGAKKWRTVKTIKTDSHGYFAVRLARRPGAWRYIYTDGPRGHSDSLILH